MKHAVVLFVGLAVIFAFAPVASSTGDVIGSIKTAKGSAFILRDGEKIEAEIGQLVHQKDVLKTGSDGSMGMIFRDDTVLSIGNDSEIEVKEFLFDPAQGKLSIVTKLVKGIASYLSGKIATISPESARFETPVATIGIRGTRFVARVE